MPLFVVILHPSESRTSELAAATMGGRIIHEGAVILPWAGTVAQLRRLFGLLRHPAVSARLDDWTIQ